MLIYVKRLGNLLIYQENALSLHRKSYEIALQFININPQR